MRYLLLLLSLGCLQSSLLTAQVGFSGYYKHTQASDLGLQFTDINGEPITDGLYYTGPGWQAGLDYWFRLKKVRIEFLPTLSAGQWEISASSRTRPITDFRIETTEASLFFKTNFYLFDLAGDCDCPTFSKEGPTLQKGFFLQLAPGMSYFRFQPEGAPIAHTTLTPAASVALGFDLGLSDLLTITPIGGFIYYPEVVWAESLVAEVEPLTADFRQWFAGLRLGFRFDQ